MRRLLALPLLMALAACEDQSMQRQARYETYGTAPLFPDRAAAQRPPEGTVEIGALAREAALRDPPPVDAALMERGRQRYEAICTPCHGYAGHGDGMVVQRGFPAPPSFHEERLRAAPAAYFVDVITRGYGVMYPYADRVEPRDRWAIALYIRALQLSQGARLAEAPDLRERLP